MRYIMFNLSMPNVGSWNNKWSGERDLHAVIHKIRGRSQQAKIDAQKLIDKITGSYYYDFGDGWGASVSVKEVTATEATVIERKSKGFCGYNWMIDEIKFFGKILSIEERCQYEGSIILSNVLKNDVVGINNLKSLGAFIEAKRQYLISINRQDDAMDYTTRVHILLHDRDLEFKTDSELESEVSKNIAKSLNIDIVETVLNVTHNDYLKWDQYL